jgi:hypothetical protein
MKPELPKHLFNAFDWLHDAGELQRFVKMSDSEAPLFAAAAAADWDERDADAGYDKADEGTVDLEDLLAMRAWQLKHGPCSCSRCK